LTTGMRSMSGLIKSADETLRLVTAYDPRNS
jgi:hypothetical protein